MLPPLRHPCFLYQNHYSSKLSLYHLILIHVVLIYLIIINCRLFSQCVPVSFQGFHRGSYHCICKRGYYFPDPGASRKYFSGQVLEEEYDKMLRGESNFYEENFECLACSEGCEDCVDDRACVFDIYTTLRYTLLVMNCLVVLISLAFAALVYKYWRNKVKQEKMREK